MIDSEKRYMYNVKMSEKAKELERKENGKGREKQI